MKLVSKCRGRDGRVPLQRCANAWQDLFPLALRELREHLALTGKAAEHVGAQDQVEPRLVEYKLPTGCMSLFVFINSHEIGMSCQMLEKTQSFDPADSHAAARLDAAEPQSSARWDDPAVAALTPRGKARRNRAASAPLTSSSSNHPSLKRLDFHEPFEPADRQGDFSLDHRIAAAHSSTASLPTDSVTCSVSRILARAARIGASKSTLVVPRPSHSPSTA